MKDAPFAHIGGAVIADHGPVALAEAGDLVVFYAAEALRVADGRWARICRRRAQALHDAAEEAALWRRAAGWADPRAADGRL